MGLTGQPTIGLKPDKPEPSSKARKPIRKVSKKRAAHQRSPEGKAELAWMGRVKQLPCVICDAPPPSDAHHLMHGRYGNRKPSGYNTIPLCKNCHQDGPEAFHKGKKTWKAKHGPDYGFLPLVRALLDPQDTIDF